MIRFVDLKTGNTFEGSSPYVFWLDGEQSINMIYSQPICFISNSQKVTVSIEKNNIFSLIDPDLLLNSEMESIYGFEYHNIQKLKTTSITSIGTSHHNYYIHIIYIIGSAQQAGEYIANFLIKELDEEYSYMVGGDFYGEDESLYINLANNGVEIPEVIQKALYDVNIHEEKRDNITLNRKWKELLSNFWDVIANKGSYKSLFNSLKWFEYGDTIRLYEMWKNTDTNMYLAKDIQQILSNKYLEELNGFTKTTYIALNYALEETIKNNEGRIVLDEEKNPKLKYLASKWSTQDLALKLCLLGNFYETYFMPIHLDLIHSTIEDIVYTNTFKVRYGSLVDRTDYIYNCDDIKCNVKNGDVYRLGLVDCYVTPETLFGSKYDLNKKSVTIVGVQKEPATNLGNNDDLRNYVSQLYREIGAIVDFEIDIPNTKIKREVIVFKTFANNQWTTQTITDYKLLNNQIKFSLFCPIEGDYDVRLQFDSIDGRTFVKRVQFNVVDTEHSTIKIYKIQNLGSLENCQVGQQCQINDYISSRRFLPQDKSNGGLQYIPAYLGGPYVDDKLVYEGVCLNHLLILKDKEDKNKVNENDLNAIEKHYFLLKRPVGEKDSKYYTICVSKTFGFRPTNNEDMREIYNSLKDKKLIYREDYIFMPEFHKLVPLIPSGEEYNIESYKITDFDSLCVIPELTYGKNIEWFDWEFINASNPNTKPIQLSYIKEPFITNNEKLPLNPGYYNVKFHYRLTNENKINTVSLDSAFIKV